MFPSLFVKSFTQTKLLILSGSLLRKSFDVLIEMWDNVCISQQQQQQQHKDKEELGQLEEQEPMEEDQELEEQDQEGQEVTLLLKLPNMVPDKRLK